jgi:hypothetical protein
MLKWEGRDLARRVNAGRMHPKSSDLCIFVVSHCKSRITCKGSANLARGEFRILTGVKKKGFRLWAVWEVPSGNSRAMKTQHLL